MALKGINFGGWLVAEKWMTPSLFAYTDAKDEWSLMFTPDGEERIRRHRETFITENDFAWAKDHGYELVRLPIGYWGILEDEHYCSGKKKLEWAVSMAEKYHLKLLVCLHGAPGSQNGHDHSGKIGPADWYKSEQCRKKTTEALLVLAQRFGANKGLWGIELLNEPKWRLNNRVLKRFYRETYEQITRVARKGLVVVYSDAWQPRRMSGVIVPKKDFPVWMDIHWYHFLFPFFKIMPLAWYYYFVRRRVCLIERLSKKQPIMIGEWSGVLAWEKMRPLTQEQRNEAQNMHKDLQQKIYQVAAAELCWTYKTEESGPWSVHSQG